MPTRRQFLHLTGSGLAVSIGSALLSGCCSGDHCSSAHPADMSPPGNQPRTPLRLPKNYSGAGLSAEATVHEWTSGRSSNVLTLGGSYPAPTIRVRKGELFSVQFTNKLAEDTNIHWHGLVTPADMDGHPKDPVKPGASFTYRFAVRQRPGTYFYHPHAHEATGKQVYLGMAGFYLVEDDEERALGLPSGEFDVPLLIQDRRLLGGPSLAFEPTMADMMEGFLGDTLVVNGVPDPQLDVAAGLYRLRLLNGSNARILKLAFAGMLPFAVIGTDGGLLDKPVSTTSIWLGPAERVEILVDFSTVGTGQSVMLQSVAFTAPSGGHGGGHGGAMAGGIAQGTALDVLRFDVRRAGAAGRVPERLLPLEQLDPAQAQRTRAFTLAMNMQAGATRGMHTINGKTFDMQRVDAQIAFGATEIWELRSMDEGSIHPMHLHGVQFQVLSRSGGPLTPSDQGWKDTVLVFPMETVRVIARFNDYRGLYLLHCHTLEHEDDGMMLNLQIG